MRKYRRPRQKLSLLGETPTEEEKERHARQQSFFYSKVRAIPPVWGILVAHAERSAHIPVQEQRERRRKIEAKFGLGASPVPTTSATDAADLS